MQRPPDLTWILWVLYLLPLVPILGLTKRDPSGKVNVYWIVASLAASLPIGFACGMVTANVAIVLCNCGADYVCTGNNHFDEDVMFSNAVGLSALFTVYVHAFWLQRKAGSVFLLLIHLLMVMGAIALLLAIAASARAPGCSCST